jgi:hypothetical protein
VTLQDASPRRTRARCSISFSVRGRRRHTDRRLTAGSRPGRPHARAPGSHERVGRLATGRERKADGSVSLADAYAVALAHERDAVLVVGADDDVDELPIEIDLRRGRNRSVWTSPETGVGSLALRTRPVSRVDGLLGRVSGIDPAPTRFREVESLPKAGRPVVDRPRRGRTRAERGRPSSPRRRRSRSPRDARTVDRCRRRAEPSRTDPIRSEPQPQATPSAVCHRSAAGETAP